MKNFEKYKDEHERTEAFWKYYAGHMLPYDAVQSFARWLNLEAEEEKPLPCIYCGKECRVYHSSRGDGCWLVACDYCGYESGHIATKEGAIERHNRVARDAAKAKEANDENAK